MSELNATISFLEDSVEEYPGEEEEIVIAPTENIPFDIQKFRNELELDSSNRNKLRAERPNQNITGYDLAHNCIQQVLFKLRNTPIRNYADVWLPIRMRTELGNAVHRFIQENSKQFSEIELNLKVPSLRFYGKIDYVIGDQILGEIKSCTYTDYHKIIKTQQPREKDLLQAMTYYYFLMNHLEEIKAESTVIANTGGSKPKLNKYDIKQLQFVYVCHDIISSDAESFGEIMELVKTTKKLLSSKYNQFFFITSILVDLDEELVEHCSDFVNKKVKDILKYIKSKGSPTAKSRFVNLNGCFFCPYRDICDLNVKKTAF